MDNFYTFPSFRESMNGEIVGQFLGGLEEIWPPELAADHKEGREQEGTFGPHVGSGVEGGVEEIDKWVEAEEEEIEKHLCILFGNHTRGNRVLGTCWDRRNPGLLNIVMRWVCLGGGPVGGSFLWIEDGPEERVALVLALDEFGGVKLLVFIAVFLVIIFGLSASVAVGSGRIRLAVLIGRYVDRRKAVGNVLRSGGRRGRVNCVRRGHGRIMLLGGGGRPMAILGRIRGCWGSLSGLRF